MSLVNTLHTNMPFCQNEEGHYIGGVAGSGLTAEEELARLEERDLLVDDSARQLLQFGADIYNNEHRLEKDGLYSVALVPASQLEEKRFSQRTNTNFLALGNRFKYFRPPAEVQLRLHGRLTKYWLKKLGFHWIASLHTPILNKEHEPTMLYSRLFADGLTLTTDSGRSSREWHDNGVFAYLV